MKRIKLARGFICSTDSRFANQPHSVNCCTNPRNRELCPYDGDRASLHQKSREGKEKKLNIAIFLLTVQNQQRFEP